LGSIGEIEVLRNAEPSVRKVSVDYSQVFAAGSFADVHDLAPHLGFAREALQRSGLATSAKILDSGAGTGAFAVPAAEAGLEVLASTWHRAWSNGSPSG
jgi:2-polyprenyl-3-methyl-5-hydroxy-6-metoxy-1,4-benzoquinol methylase